MPSLNKLHSHKTRYVWLRNRHHLGGEEFLELTKQKSMMLKTAQAWLLKEKARDIWKGIEPPTKTSWKKWIKLATESGIKPMVTAAKTIQKHLQGILRAIQNDVSNARAEAINKNIKNLSRMAHGYRNKERYKALIMLRYDQLDMSFPH